MDGVGGGAPIGWLKTVVRVIKDHSWPVQYVGYIILIGFTLTVGSNFIDLSKDYDDVINQLTIIVSLLLLMVGGIVRETSLKRERRFASIQRDSHNIHHKIRDLQTYLSDVLADIDAKRSLGVEISFDQIELGLDKSSAALTEILDKFSKCFSTLSGGACRASIKGVYKIQSRSFVYTVARDSSSQDENLIVDRERQEGNLDPLEENEDFSIIWNNNSSWFFEGFLPARPDYVNSKDPELKEKRQRFSRRGLSVFYDRSNWKLPYVSTIVWPIRQQESRSLPIDNVSCLGFLTVDSDRKDAFVERFDAQFGAGIADSLYHAIQLYAELAECYSAANE